MMKTSLCKGEKEGAGRGADLAGAHPVGLRGAVGRAVRVPAELRPRDRVLGRWGPGDQVLQSPSPPRTLALLPGRPSTTTVSQSESVRSSYGR